MSWSGTYTHTLAYALDISGACIFWNQADITISSLCWLVMMADKERPVDVWGNRLAALKLYGWQIALLRYIGPVLDRIQPNHRQLAQKADIERAKRVLGLLLL